MSNALQEQLRVLDNIEKAMITQLQSVQLHDRRISDGMIMESCARIIGKLMAVQHLPAAQKEKTLLKLHEKMQHHAGLNVHGGMLDG